jgi:hypothetical protein
MVWVTILAMAAASLVVGNGSGSRSSAASAESGPPQLGRPPAESATALVLKKVRRLIVMLGG